MSDPSDLVPSTGELIFYRAADGDRHIRVLLQDENFWMPQKDIAELFGVRVPAISKHLANIYESGELQRAATISILETVRQEGFRRVTRQIEHYNLDAIIAVGYRVNSYQATQFRIWATNTLKEYVVKGFVLDDERLKQGRHFGQDYFEELLERIRKIRASERRFYQKITDLYALSADYDRDAPIRLVDYDDPDNNDWVVANQFTVKEAGRTRRPDVMVFLNGLPVGIIELINAEHSRALCFPTP